MQKTALLYVAFDQETLFFDLPLISTKMKQNSTKNMILSHLEDIKAKIEQKSINNIKLPFERPFKDRYTGRSPERILCLYSVSTCLRKSNLNLTLNTP